MELLCLGARQLGPDDLPDVERLLRESQTWALVDALCVGVVAPIVAGNPATGATLDRWSTDDDFWIRRSAMLCLLPDLRRGGGDWERFTRYADAMLEDKEFFIRKVIGWVLRDTSKRRPELVYEWFAPRAHRASGTTVREVIRRLPDQMALDIKQRYDSR